MNQQTKIQVMLQQDVSHIYKTGQLSPNGS